MDANAIYNEHKNLVHHWVGRYARLCNERQDIDTDDLFQSGCMGLIEAAKTYRPELGTWGTWASFYIRKNIRETLGLRTSKYFYTVTLSDGTTERRRYIETSLDAPAYSEDDPTTVIETLADPEPPDFNARLFMDDDTRRIHAALNAIDNPNAREAVTAKYFGDKTTREIAESMETDVLQVRRWIRFAIRRLFRDKHLKAIYRERHALDEGTRFFAHKGIAAFFSTGSSVVEDAVIWRESRRKCREAERLDALIAGWNEKAEGE